MSIELLCEALRQRCCLEVHYDGHVRVVEVHVVGHTRDGQALVRVWQVSGGSKGGEPVGWKLMRVDEISQCRMTTLRSRAPREGYNVSDPAMPRVECQV